LQAGTVLTREMLDVLRPAPRNAIFPYDMEKTLGRTLLVDLQFGEALMWSMLGD
jgi:sialic acid synthase SpsE